MRYIFRANILFALLFLPFFLNAELPFVRGDTFRELAQHYYDNREKMKDGSQVQPGDIIFVKTELLREFREKIFPTLSVPFLLITHNSDASSPGVERDFLEEELLIHWFGQNPDYAHPKMTGIPIGVANDFDSWGRPIQHGKLKHLAYMCEFVEQHSKEKLLYFNFLVASNPQKRFPVYEYFRQQSYCREAKKRPYLGYLADMIDYKYAVCPPGNGLDCHRTWECLYLGIIPIIEHSSLDPLLDGLPILFVDTWTEITEQFLLEKYEEITSSSYHMEKIYWPYWKELILNAQKKARGD